MIRYRLLLSLCLALGWAAGLGANEPLRFTSEAEETRFEALTRELRCLVCQNQSLADSDAPLAHDLRREVLSMMQQGHSDTEIRRFLVERYGDFVLYRPPVKGNTIGLWLAPALLLLAGGLVVAVNIRRRSALLASDDGGETNS